LAFLRGRIRRHYQVPGLPQQDRWALGLLAAIVAVGFLLEGMRIAMTNRPEGSELAFLGHSLSLLFWESQSWTEIFGYLWYLHAILTGAFLVYLPFSRMLHIIAAPLLLAAKGTSNEKHGGGGGRRGAE
jgi:nitrate reductase gamma subunit